ncbi:MAG: hypothetical protein QNJ46_29315 [Leptolyngbyaceae cyanobacterium MO_188.B28]|nr:hypothetical protein [Leptolyngbyaceae cyanobacterium MO_188.B28]
MIEESHENGPYGILTEKDIVYKVIAQGDNPHFVQVGGIMCQKVGKARKLEKSLLTATVDTSSGQC